MLIHKIRLVNFISHKDTVIELSQGLTAIIGRNGAGKTSILDAISYALFKEHSRGREENLINRRAFSAQVQLLFSSNGRSYEITWKIERGKRALAVLKDAQSGSPILVDAGERTVIPEMERILGISRDVFLNAAYIRQGEIAELLKARPAERKELISKLLGIEALEKIWESLRTPIKILENRLERLREKAGREPELRRTLEDHSSQLLELQKKLESERVKLKDLEDRLKEVEERIKVLEEERSRIEGLREALSKLERLIDSKRRELDNARRELEIVEGAEEKIRRLDEVKMERERLRREVEEIREEISKLKILKSGEEDIRRRIDDVSDEVRSLKGFISESLRKLEEALQSGPVEVEEFSEKLSSALDEYGGERERLRERISRLMEEIGELRGRRESLLNHLEELEAGGAVCPLCKRPMDERHRERVLEEIRGELEEVENKIRILEVERDELKLDLERVNSILDELGRLDRERFEEAVIKIRSLESELSELKRLSEAAKHASSELEKLEEKLEEKLSRLRRVEEELIELERGRGLIETLGSAELLRRRINGLISEIAELENKKKWMEDRISKSGYSLGEYEKLRREENAILKEIGDLKAAISSIIQKMENLESERKRLEKELGEAEEASRKAKALESYIRLLKTIRECFSKDGVQRYARTLAKKSIEYYAKRFLQFFSLTYSDLRLDEDYNVYLYGPLGEQTIDSLSGGEKTAVALCLRLGIAAALTGNRIRCILMDEPTTHLDPERRRELVKLLTNFKGEKGLIPQTIIVTHDPEVEQAADQVYHVTLRKGYSHVKRV